MKVEKTNVFGLSYALIYQTILCLEKPSSCLTKTQVFYNCRRIVSAKHDVFAKSDAWQGNKNLFFSSNPLHREVKTRRVFQIQLVGRSKHIVFFKYNASGGKKTHVFLKFNVSAGENTMSFSKSMRRKS